MQNMTQEISANNNLSIIIHPQHWQLKRTTAEGALVIATAEGVRYSASFAQTRRLPANIPLTSVDITQVTIGWEARDEAWHLGFVLVPAIAEQRASRWCELAMWHDPERNLHQELAQQAGRTLANLLQVNFYEAPLSDDNLPEANTPEITTSANGLAPQTASDITPDTTPDSFVTTMADANIPPSSSAPEIPLPELPLSLGDWRIEREANSLAVQLIREPRWHRQQLLQASWSFLWALIYAIVSILTLTSEIALPSAGTLIPNPQILPIIGLITAFVLLLRSLYLLWRRPRVTQRIVIDPQSQTISAHNTAREQWRRNTNDVLSVYVSEIISKKQSDRTTEHGEIHLHLGTGNFIFLLQQGDKLNHDDLPEPHEVIERQKSGIQPLSSATAFSTLQIAGLYLSKALGDTPVWYDMRLN
jgi:hypothetical protein